MSEAASDRRPTPEVVEPGAVIANKFTILRRLAGGPPGSWLSRPKGSDPLVGLHILYPQPNPTALARQFEQELQAIAQLRHAQLLQILDFGRDSRGFLFVAYEPLEQPNLLQLIENEWPMPSERIVHLVLQLLAALEVGHAASVWHGDLQPGNLLVRPGDEELVLCGLGLAKYSPFRVPPAAPQAPLELGPYFVGTPEYAAPEQLRGEAHDARSDIYGAGILLFQLLTGAPPFVGETVHEVAWKQCYTPPPPPSGYTGVSAELEAVCLKALSKTPEIRYQSVDEMRAALLAALSKPERLSRRNSSIRVRPSRSSEPALLGQVVRASTAPVEAVKTEQPQGRPSLSLATRNSLPNVLLPARITRDAFTAVTFAAPEEEPTKRRRGTGFGLLLGGCLIGALGASAATHYDQLAPLMGSYASARSVEETSDDEPAPRDFFADDPTLPLDRDLARASAASAASPASDASLPAVVEENNSLASEDPAGDGNTLVAIAPPTRGPDDVAPAAAAAKPAPIGRPSSDAALANPQPSAALRRAVRPRQPPVIEVTPIPPTSAAAPVAPTPAANTLLSPEQAEAAKLATKELMVALADPANALGATAPLAAGVAQQPELKITPVPPTPNFAPPAAADSQPPPAAPPAAKLPPAPPPAPRNASPALSESARVAFGDANSAHGAVSKNSLRAALNQAAVTRCYRDAVRAGQAPAAPLHAELDFATNQTGRIVSAKLRGTGVPASLESCVEGAARVGRVREADTGAVQATVAVSFLPE